MIDIQKADEMWYYEFIKTIMISASVIELTNNSRRAVYMPYNSWNIFTITALILDHVEGKNITRRQKS